MKRKSVFFLYLLNNKRNFMMLTIFFSIGIVLGIAFVNHISSVQSDEISSYINGLIDYIKMDNQPINRSEMLIQCIKKNLIFALLIWFLGYTFLASFLIDLAIVYKGFSIGYTLSSIIATLGVKLRNGIYFVIYAITKFNFYSYYFYSFQ